MKINQHSITALSASKSKNLYSLQYITKPGKGQKIGVQANLIKIFLEKSGGWGRIGKWFAIFLILAGNCENRMQFLLKNGINSDKCGENFRELQDDKARLAKYRFVQK